MKKNVKDVFKTKGQRIFALITSILLILSAGAFSYAVFVVNYQGLNVNQIKTCGIDITFKDDNPVRLLSTVPLTATEAANLTPYTFYIKSNDSSCRIVYKLSMDSICNSCSKTNGICTLEDNTTCNCSDGHQIDPSLIAYSIKNTATNEEIIGVGVNNISETFELLSGEIDTYEMKIWIDASVTNEDLYVYDGSGNILENADGTYVTKNFCGKLNVKATVFDNLDTSGANAPVLATGMIPVYYDGSVWRKADSTNKNETYKWYDYEDKMWANAVTVTQSNGTRSDLVNAPVGTEIPISRINTMLVWIPRFSATMNGSYNGGSKANPGAFNITFVDTNTTAHDAFDFGGAISGFWMAKFEVSTGTTNCDPANYSVVGEGCNLITINPYSIPNASPWQGAMVSTYYSAMLEMKTEASIYGFDTSVDTTLDTHMLKNNEWGAVAYLTQSIYGRCTTNTSCTEVGINNNSSFITGYGAPAGSSSSVTNGAYNTPLGMDASTTRNIYGVYDMSGGAEEYVMGVYWDGSKYWSGYNTSNNLHSGFNGCLGISCSSTLETGLAYPSDRKYYNLYTTSSAYTSSGLQHAMVETKNWYGDYDYFVNGVSPWVVRGGYYDNSSYAGVFNFSNTSGNAYARGSSRLSLVK